MTRRAPALALVLALASSAGTARGQTHSAAADALFREGVNRAEAGDFAAAVEKFKASYELENAAGTLQGLAMAEERWGRLAAAVAHYRALVDRAVALKDKKREKLARDRIAALEPRLGKLMLVADQPLPDGAEITLDGQTLPMAVVGTELPVDPGTHTLTGRAKDGSKLAQSFQLKEGEKLELPLGWTRPTAAPVAPPEPEPRRPKETMTVVEPASHDGLRTAGIVVAGAGVVLAGAGTYFWLKSNATYDELDGACPGGHCPKSLEGRVDDGKQQETLARIGVGVGLLAIGTGVGLWIFGGRSAARESAHVRGFVGPRSVGVAGCF